MSETFPSPPLQSSSTLTSWLCGKSVQPWSPSCMRLEKRSRKKRREESQSGTEKYWGLRGGGGIQAWRRWVCVKPLITVFPFLCWIRKLLSLINIWPNAVKILAVPESGGYLWLRNKGYPLGSRPAVVFCQLCSVQWWDKLDYERLFYFMKLCRYPVSQDCNPLRAHVRSLFSHIGFSDCVLAAQWIHNLQTFIVCVCGFVCVWTAALDVILDVTKEDRFVSDVVTPVSRWWVLVGLCDKTVSLSVKNWTTTQKCSCMFLRLCVCVGLHMRRLHFKWRL